MKPLKQILTIGTAIIMLASLAGCNKSKSSTDTDTTTESASVSENSVDDSITAEYSTISTSSTSTTESTSSTTSTSSTSTTASTKKKSALRVTDKSKDRTYRGDGFCMAGAFRFYENPDWNSKLVEEVDNGEVIVTDYRYDEIGNTWFKASGHKGWSDEISCALHNYIQIAMDICYNGNNTNSYAVYDIDNDGTAEWIFQYGKYAYQYEYRVYTVKPSTKYAEKIGTIPYGSLYVDDKGNLITKVEKMGYESAYQVEYHNGALNYKLLFENSGLEEYTKPGEAVPMQSVYSFIDSTKYYYRSSEGHNIQPEDDDDSDYDVDPANRVQCFLCGEIFWVQDEEKTCPYCGAQNNNGATYNEEPNIVCSYCGYEDYITGVGTEGFKCPNCGKWIIEPMDDYDDEQTYTDPPVQETEYIEPETEAPYVPEQDPVYDEPMDEYYE